MWKVLIMDIMRWHLLAAVVLMFGLVACSGNQTTPSMDKEDGYGTYRMSPPSPEDEKAEEVEGLEAAAGQWGIKVLGIRTTADGYMLDFRYQVIDAAKATPLLDRRNKSYLLVEKSEVKLAVPVSPKIGAMRQTSRHVKAGRNYFVMFANPSRHVKPGDRVKVVIGDFKSQTLIVM